MTQTTTFVNVMEAQATFLHSFVFNQARVLKYPTFTRIYEGCDTQSNKALPKFLDDNISIKTSRHLSTVSKERRKSNVFAFSKAVASRNKIVCYAAFRS